MKNYSCLHTYSHFSLLEGLSKPEHIATRCNKTGIESCALTDHGNIAGAVQFYKHMKEAKVKPILGCELYISKEDSSIKTKENKDLGHFVILAKNLKGWKTLINIISESNHPDNYYHKPRLSMDRLQKFLDGNILGYCGHLGSTLADLLGSSADSIEKTGSEYIAKMRDYFGADNFFLETQLMDREHTPKQIELTEHIRRLGGLTKTKVICTPNAHYCEREDCTDQQVLLCNNLGMTFPAINKKILNNEPVELDQFFKSDNFYMLSPEEMASLHSEEEIENTNLVNSLCEEYSILNKPFLPAFACPNGQKPDEYLRQLCRNGWKSKIEGIIDEKNKDKYVERVKYELEVLQGAGLSSYFLIVQDIVDFVRSKNWLPGPGRGSGAGCLVSYLIGITAIDPIPYDLIFERFYNAGRNTKDRISMPDIDVDVPKYARETIIQYMKDKYGSARVSQMITFNTMKGRGALKDVLRSYGNTNFEEMNRITKYIPDESKISDELQDMKEATGESSIIQWALENNVDKLKEWCYISDDGSLAGPLAKRFEQAIRLEGTKVNLSKHAAGVAISSEELKDVCPLVYDTKKGEVLAGMEMADLEAIGVLKLDILGITMLDKIMNVSSMLRMGV